MIYRNLFNKENYEALRDLQVSFSWSNQQLDYLIACMKFESNLNPAAVYGNLYAFLYRKAR